ncbi:MAG: ABC transporter permease [Actinobacteria bacterium]|nr:ABC transporter permease [Actinomycetota bacterium]MBW3648066.1 ABC transporter permease [Actinomycetota bacterium]
MFARAIRTPGGLVGIVTVLAWILVGVAAPLLAPYDPFAIEGPALAAPSAAYPFGTDDLGRDLLSGVIWGARTSLIVAAGVAVLVVVIGSAVGLLSGYRGGWVDDALMRSTEAFQVLPRFFLALVVIAFFGPGLDKLVLVLGVTSWPLLARVVRAEVLALRSREFVEAARVQGATWNRILLREILPNALPPAIALLGLVVAQVILIEASLGFLGLGDPNVTSWGALASEAQRFLRVAWWLSLFPGLAILLAVLGLNLLGDAVTDALSGRR